MWVKWSDSCPHVGRWLKMVKVGGAAGATLAIGVGVGMWVTWCVWCPHEGRWLKMVERGGAAVAVLWVEGGGARWGQVLTRASMTAKAVLHA